MDSSSVASSQPKTKNTLDNKILKEKLVEKLDAEEREFYMVASTLLKFSDSVRGHEYDDELTYSLRKQVQQKLNWKRDVRFTIKFRITCYESFGRVIFHNFLLKHNLNIIQNFQILF